MTQFRFPLEKVLELRRTQLEIEELKFRNQTAAIAELNRSCAEIEAAGRRTETTVRGWNSVAGCDLAALGGYRLRVQQQAQEITGKRVECERNLDVQRGVMMEARRRVRLMERLRERRKAEWQVAADKEMEELASESFLAQWSRGR